MNLSDWFYIRPETANTTMTAAQLRSLLLQTDGEIVTKGVFWTIRSKHMAVGVYRVYLERKKYER